MTEENNVSNNTEEQLDRKTLEKLTNLDLAKMVADKTLSRHKVTTLKSYSKKRLIDLLLGIEKETDKTTARTPQTESEADDIVNSIVDVLGTVKQTTVDEKAKTNSVVTRVFKTNAVKVIDKALAEDKLSFSGFNKVLTVIAGLALLIDTFIGIENVPKYIKSKLEKFKKKNESKDEKQPQNTPQTEVVYSMQ